MKIQTQFGTVNVLTNCPLLDSTEYLEFKTEVHENYDGSEDRLNLRDQPRQELRFKYVTFKRALGDMFHMLYANLRGLWGIPMKQIKLKIPDLDSDFLPFDTKLTKADFRVGFILLESDEGIQVAEITEIGRYVVTQQEIRDPETDEIIQEEIVKFEDGFRFSESITATNAYMTPLRICIIDGDASIAASGFYAGQEITFKVLDEDCPDDVGAEPEQYKGEDIYFKPLVLEGDSLSMALTQHQVIVDGEIGGFQDFTNWEKPRYTKPFKSILKSKEEYSQYKNFLFRRLGKYKAFWMPLYEKHLNITSTGLNWIEVDNDYVIEADRKNLAVKINGIWSAHSITAINKNGSKTRLTVSPSLDVLPSQIQSICYLGLYRLAADSVEFSFLGNSITQVNVPIVELHS